MQHAAGDDRRRGTVGPGAQHDELVAAEASERVARSHKTGQPLGDGDECRIPRVVADGVVDDLEPVEVDEQDTHGLVGAPADGERLTDAIEGERPVGETGELVVEGQPHELFFGALAFGDVTRRRLQLHDLTVADDRGDHGLEPRVRTAATADAIRELDRLAAGRGVDVEAALDVRSLVGVDVVDRMGADELVGLVAQQASNRRARVLIDAVRCVQAHEIGCALGQRAEAGLGLGQRARSVGQRGAQRMALGDVQRLRSRRIPPATRLGRRW